MRSAAMLYLAVLAGCEEPPRDKLAPVTESTGAVAVSPSISPEIHPSAPLVPPKPGYAKHLQAFGTEPFWSIAVLPGALRYSAPDNLDGIGFASTESKEGKGVRYTGTMQGKKVVLLIKPGTCSDGMSDTVYDWQAALTIDGKTDQGCARLK